MLNREKARAWLLRQFGLPALADEISDQELDELAACWDDIPPGRCPSRLELMMIRPDGAGGVVRLPEVHLCSLLATHAGLHREDPPLDGFPVEWTETVLLERDALSRN